VTAVILEHLLRELANRRDIGLQPRLSARNTATLLERAGVIDKNMRVAVDEVTSIRNRAVHATGREPNQEEAQFVLDTARKISQIP
jgi:uncharacterized protein YutE (UPF0331/DUF86 family)